MLKLSFLLMAGLMITASAQAQSRSDRAMTAYKAGLEAMKTAQYDRAIERFKRALELRPGAAVYYALGLAHERKGEPRAARRFYKRVLALAKMRPRRVRREVVKRTRAGLERLDAQTTRAQDHGVKEGQGQLQGELVVTSDISGAMVLLGTRVLGPADGETALALPAGPHRLTVRAPERPDTPLEVMVRQGARMKLTVSLAPPSRSAEHSAGLSTFDIAGISVAAVAGTALITGIALSAQVADTRSDLELTDASGRVTPASRKALADWADGAESASWAMYAIAGAGTAAALTLLLMDDSPVTAGFELSPAGSLLTVFGRW